MERSSKYFRKKFTDAEYFLSNLRYNISSIERRQWIFSAVLVINAYVVWMLVYLLFYQAIDGLFAWGLGIAFIFSLSVMVGLSFFLLYPPILAISTFFIDASIGFLFFGWRGIEGAGITILFLSTCFGYFWIRREQRLLTRFLYSRLIRFGLPIFFTGLAFALALLYNTSPVGKNLTTPQFSEEFIDLILIPIEQVAKVKIPEFSRNTPIESSTKSNEQAQGWVSKLPESEKSKTLVVFTKDLANRQITTLLAPYKRYLHVIYFFGIFLLFRAIAMPIMWTAIGVGWLVVRILLYKRVIRIQTVKAKKEILVL